MGDRRAKLLFLSSILSGGRGCFWSRGVLIDGAALHCALQGSPKGQSCSIYHWRRLILLKFCGACCCTLQLD